MRHVGCNEIAKRERESASAKRNAVNKVYPNTDKYHITTRGESKCTKEKKGRNTLSLNQMQNNYVFETI